MFGQVPYSLDYSSQTPSGRKDIRPSSLAFLLEFRREFWSYATRLVSCRDPFVPLFGWDEVDARLWWGNQ